MILANLIFNKIFKYVQTIKKELKKIVALSFEVDALYDIFNHLNLVSSQLEKQTFDSIIRTHHINFCTQTFKDLNKILNKDSTSSIQNQRIKVIKRKLH